MTTAMPQAWADLLEALNLLAQHPAGDSGPFYCSHETLTVFADDTAFTPDEIARLDQLGFIRDTNNGAFYSYRYWSA